VQIISKRQIFSVGHSNRTLDDLVSILKHYGIEALADIRSYPRSKRNPHFDREVLEKELPAHGIEYVWINELGGLREWGYEGYMGTPGFEYGLSSLEALASGNRTAFMCSELDWRRCHRSFVSRALHSRGWEVVHIYDENESETHSGLF
jgi:uncharacterized protein (DUF488 family)